jgi:hypothetical protein
MKFCNIYVRDIDADIHIDIDHIPFQCGDKLAENEERKKEKEKHEIELDKEKLKVLNSLK